MSEFAFSNVINSGSVVATETVVMVISSVYVTCGMLVVVLMTMTMAESSVGQHGDEDVETAAAIEALARALQHYRRPAHLAGQLRDGDWAAEKKREAALDVDYGWGGGRFGKRRMADRLAIAGRFGRSVDAVNRRSSS